MNECKPLITRDAQHPVRWVCAHPLFNKVCVRIMPMSQRGGRDMAGSDLYTGTLDVLILKALSVGPQHGYAIGLWLRKRSEEVLHVQEGVLYPALHRLLRKKWVQASWGVTETNRRAKFYSLTSAGRKHLTAETKRLTEHSEAVLNVLGALRS